MQRHGYNQKIDSRSLKNRGIIRNPEQHFGFESAGRLTPEQKQNIKNGRGLSAGATIEQAKSIDYTDKNWIKAIGADVKQQQLVKSLTQDISQQNGRLMNSSITPSGNVSIEKVKSRGISGVGSG